LSVICKVLRISTSVWPQRQHLNLLWAFFASLPLLMRATYC